MSDILVCKHTDTHTHTYVWYAYLISSEAVYLQIFCFFLELTFTETYKVMEEMQQVF